MNLRDITMHPAVSRNLRNPNAAPGIRQLISIRRGMSDAAQCRVNSVEDRRPATASQPNVRTRLLAALNSGRHENGKWIADLPADLWKLVSEHLSLMDEIRNPADADPRHEERDIDAEDCHAD